MRKKPCPDALEFHPKLAVPSSAARRKRFIRKTMLLLLTVAVAACSARYYTECLATTPFTGIGGNPEESVSAHEQAKLTRKWSCHVGAVSDAN